MKWGAIAMLVVVASLIAIAASRGDGSVTAGFRAGGLGLLKFLPILALAFVVMGFVEVLLPQDIVQGWLSEESGWRGIGAAWVAGIITPGGSIIGMPLAAGLLKAGVGPSILVTYLTSLAVLSMIRMPLEIGFYGWRLMTLRILASLALPLVAGGLTKLLGPWVMGSGGT